MADLEWPERPERTSLRRALRHRLRLDAPGLRVIAEDFLTDSSTIDLLGVGSAGELVSIRLCEEPGEDALLLTRSLADLTWLRHHGPDLAKLSPGLGLETGAEPRALLFCPRFSTETLAAFENFPTGTLSGFRYRSLRQQGHLSLMIEPCEFASVDRAAAAAPSRLARRSRDMSSRTAPSPVETRLTAPPSPSTFRTGLTDADLELSPAAPVSEG